MSDILRISGLVSGIDTKSLIDQLMAIERRPITILEQRKAILEERANAIKDILTRISNLQAKIAPLLSRDTLRARSVSSSDQSLVEASAQPGTAQGTYRVYVSRTATQTRVAATGSIGAPILNTSLQLQDLNTSQPIKTGTFTVNGHTIEIKTVAATLQEVLDAITGHPGENVTVDGKSSGVVDTGIISANIYENENRITLRGNGPISLGSSGDTSNFLSVMRLFSGGSTVVSSGGIGVLQTWLPLENAKIGKKFASEGLQSTTNGAFAINGVTISYNTSTDTIKSIMDRINSSEAGVIASYSPLDDKIVLVSKSTGSTQITISDVSGNLMRALGLLGTTTVSGVVQSSSNSGSVTATSGGLPTSNANVVVQIVQGGAPGTATYRVSLDGGETWGSETVIPGFGTPIDVGNGATITFYGTSFSSGDTFSFTTSLTIGPVTHTGTGTATYAAGGDPTTNAQVVIEIVEGGTDPSTVRYRISMDGGSNWGETRTGITYGQPIYLENGATFTFNGPGAGTPFVTGDRYSFSVLKAHSQGYNANFRIESDFGIYEGESRSNRISDVIPGLTLTLKGKTTSPVTITVSPDPNPTVNAMKDLISQVNSVLSFIDEKTSFDKASGKGGPLIGDFSISAIGSQIKRILSGRADGLSGKYSSLQEIGISTGAIGSAVGTTKTFLLDEGKLSSAILEDPEKVADLLSIIGGRIELLAGGTGSIKSASGSPRDETRSGTFRITSDASGNISVWFTPTGGKEIFLGDGTISPGGTNSFIIPGVVLVAKDQLVAGTDYLRYDASKKGVMVKFDGYIKGLLGSTGSLSLRKSLSDKEVELLDKRIEELEERLNAKRADLERQFLAMEKALIAIKAQGDMLRSMLGLS
jgi:flagellar capping protein FliD